ncbi:nuclease [Thermodesulfomicrobium sp. WS]|uniref:thermonuclease family protein n=1 Tax=Thermodesulfomicrobium sp. WS TaxID=3004129 RepID=UPI002493A62D|nr:thermonuclease family protein [Thermodesulfomicrobium sp. WS]BDV01177.1 nuclease [Thermodesulfomicrobium sp. WS]
MNPKAWRFSALLWLGAFLCLLATRAWAADWVQVRAAVDGDTLVLASGQTVRLAGIDAPELGHDGQPAQYYAAQSRAELQRLVDGQMVRLQVLGRDRYGRMLAVVFGRDGAMLNERMVALGAVFVFPHKDDEALFDRLLSAQRLAMDRELGFWPRILRLPAASERYVGTRSSRRFHRLSCPYASRISARNRQYFASLRSAFAAGYSPCRTCTPWPHSSR